jgi:hypothetical protein
MRERRALVRHKTFMKGRIYFNNRLQSLDCIVRDVTDTGSRLEFSENVTLPDAFELYLPTRNEYFRAHVEWRKGNQIGISWDSAKERAEAGGDDAFNDRLAKLERDVAVLQRRLDALQRT